MVVGWFKMLSATFQFKNDKLTFMESLKLIPVNFNFMSLLTFLGRSLFSPQDQSLKKTSYWANFRCLADWPSTPSILS